MVINLGLTHAHANLLLRKLSPTLKLSKMIFKGKHKCTGLQTLREWGGKGYFLANFRHRGKGEFATGCARVNLIPW